MKNKIKTIDEIKSIVGDISRKNIVTMCYGCWDIIHPGHLRHLEYLKEKSDILICGVTPDKFITKGEDRPYVPEILRANNLSFIELVDYIFIDTNSTSINAIKYLQPNYYAKGYEYSDNANPKTQEEIKALSEYNGNFIFSPGDIVYSSTKLLALCKPKITIDKLLIIMESENITFNNLINTLHKFKDIKVHVVGDTIVDVYNYCSLLGANGKTPTLSVKKESKKIFIGGAGIVAKHLNSLGADVTFTTVLGNDMWSDFVMNDLIDIKLNGILDNRTTTLKERFWCDGYKLLQVDVIDNRIISEQILDEMREKMKISSDIVIFSDFRHGIFSKLTASYLSSLIPKHTIKIADSQVNSSGHGNIIDFQNFNIILSNEMEARFALGDQDTGIRPLGLELYKKSGAKNLILKLGERGTLTYRAGNSKPKDFFGLDSFVENLVDANGAGDAMLAVVSLAYKASNNIVISSILGSLGAAIACEREGNVSITIEELEQKIEELKHG